MNAAVLFHRFGPYHLARLTAAGRRGKIVGIEVSSVTREYGWAVEPGSDHFQRVTLSQDDSALSKHELAARLTAALDAAQPRVVFVPGWSAPSARRALRWCVNNQVPAVVMSESTAHDEARVWWKEAGKRQLVQLFTAALVGGTAQRAYALRLGVATARIFLGYDAVDNGHFATGADAARADPASRARAQLPQRFFLASNRFLPKKNLPGLLRAFAAYRQQATNAAPWDLVLLGDGPLRPDLERMIGELGLTGTVHLPGFKQYADLPAFYGLAGAFVHASTSEQWGLVVNEAMASALPVLVSASCGCAPDLITDGSNGFTFSPHDPDRLAALLNQIATNPELQRQMGQASRARIAQWGTERFAEGFWAAAAAASAAPRRRPNLLGSCLLRCL